VRALKLPRIEALDLVTQPAPAPARRMPLELLVERPPGVWPWFVDKLLDATFPVRWGARRWAREQLRRHGIRCRCGLPFERRDQAEPGRDVYECVGCRRRVSRLQIEVARGRPVLTVFFGV
jgi:hypothetical protein